MEELFVLLVGAGVVALLPLVPALRPAVKAVVKGGLVVVETTKGTAAAASEQWRSVVKEANAEVHAEEHAAPAVASEAVIEA